MVQWVTHSLSKFEDLSLNPKKPCEAGIGSTCLLPGAPLVRWEVKTGESLDIYGLANWPELHSIKTTKVKGKD